MTATLSYSVALPAPLAQRPSRATFLRRRLGVVAFLVALTVSIGSVVSHGQADRGAAVVGGATAGPSTPYIVQQGDTLWAIAQRLYPGADLPLVVDAMVTLNGGATIQPGQVLALP